MGRIILVGATKGGVGKSVSTYGVFAGKHGKKGPGN